MRFIIIFLGLTVVCATGCDVEKEVRKLREESNKKQMENNLEQAKKAVENFKSVYTGPEKIEEPSGDTVKP